MNPIGIQLGLSAGWAFLVALFAVPSIIHIAHLKNMLDTPNGRTVHSSLTPRLGGVAVFAGFMSALTIFAPLQNGVKELLAGCIILFFVGLKDDLVGMSVFKKFVGQLLATGIVMIMAEPYGSQPNSSSRIHCSLTGRPPVARASSAASQAASSAPLCP